MSRRSVEPARIRIESESNVTRAVVETSRMAQDVGFNHLGRNQIATAVSELARNILKYAGTGYVVLEPIQDGTKTGLRITAVDRGPGIDDVAKALQDHYSTGGTLGLGLPGVRRLMDDLTIDSSPENGTKVTATKWL